MLDAVDPAKDVDGFHPTNLAVCSPGRPSWCPARQRGSWRSSSTTALPSRGVCPWSGVAHRGQARRPLLLARDATVTMAHADARPGGGGASGGRARRGGRPRAADRREHVKPGAAVIDVGVNRLAGGALAGDVDFAAVEPSAAAITPVPGRRRTHHGGHAPAQHARAPASAGRRLGRRSAALPVPASSWSACPNVSEGRDLEWFEPWRGARALAAPTSSTCAAARTIMFRVHLSRSRPRPSSAGPGAGRRGHEADRPARAPRRAPSRQRRRGCRSCPSADWHGRCRHRRWAVGTARRTATASIPVFFYGEAALRPERAPVARPAPRRLRATRRRWASQGPPRRRPGPTPPDRRRQHRRLRPILIAFNAC